MKKLLIFCVSLNIALAAGLALVFYLGRNEMKKRNNESLAYENSIIQESMDMLEKAGIYYAEGEYLDARVRLKMASYRIYDAKNEENAKTIGMGDWYFFESNEENPNSEDTKLRFYTFIGAVRSLVSGEELSEEESEIIDTIKISHANSAFSHNVFPSLNSSAEVEYNTAYKKALSALGEKVVVSECKSTQFPLCYTFAGKNTFASVSTLGGKLIKLYFYPGNSEYTIDEEKATEIMRTFMSREQLPEMSLLQMTKDCGIYYATFSPSKNENAKILIAVKGSGGRVCLYDSEEFYKNYKS